MQLRLEAIGAAAVANSTKKTQRDGNLWKSGDGSMTASWCNRKKTRQKKNSTSASMILGMTQREWRGKVEIQLASNCVFFTKKKEEKKLLELSADLEWKPCYLTLRCCCLTETFNNIKTFVNIVVNQCDHHQHFSLQSWVVLSEKSWLFSHLWLLDWGWAKTCYDLPSVGFYGCTLWPRLVWLLCEQRQRWRNEKTLEKLSEAVWK